MTERPHAPATERNREPILAVLAVEFAGCRGVLEIGSGTGQHAIFMAAGMPWLNWQTSDVSENHAGIRAWLAHAALDNVSPPLVLDVLDTTETVVKVDAVFSANTAHIMSIRAVERMFDLVGAALPEGGPFCLYGPFNRGGEFSSESNAHFDESLRARDPEMGIRNLEDLDAFAAASGMRRSALYAMPANNSIAVWRRAERAGKGAPPP